MDVTATDELEDVGALESEKRSFSEGLNEVAARGSGEEEGDDDEDWQKAWEGWEWTVLPMGTQNAPATFQRAPREGSHTSILSQSRGAA